MKYMTLETMSNFSKWRALTLYFSRALDLLSKKLKYPETMKKKGTANLHNATTIPPFAPKLNSLQ